MPRALAPGAPVGAAPLPFAPATRSWDMFPNMSPALFPRSGPDESSEARGVSREPRPSRGTFRSAPLCPGHPEKDTGRLIPACSLAPVVRTRRRRRLNGDLRRAHDGLAIHLAQAAELDEAGDGAGKGDLLERRVVGPGAAGEGSRPGLAVGRDADLVLPDAAGTSRPGGGCRAVRRPCGPRRGRWSSSCG